MENKNYFALLDNTTGNFVTRQQAIDAGSDLIYLPFNELFSDDDGELALIVHDAGKEADWDCVPVSVNINFTRK